MTSELHSDNTVPEDRIGKVHDWGEMSSFLPSDIVAESERFLRAYFKAQLFLQEGKRVKAKRLFSGLDRTTGYSDFEDSNQDVLRIIDLAVRGESRWQF